MLLLIALLVPQSPTVFGETVPLGPDSWELSTHNGTIAGFASQVSAAPGDRVDLFVSTPAPTFEAAVYRLGLEDSPPVLVLSDLPGTVQPLLTLEPDSGLLSAANWTRSASFSVGAWRSGLYLIKLSAADGDQAYVPLVIRDDVGDHAYLFVHASSTDQAYNAWGGKSLYEFNSSGSKTVSGGAAAVKVSFDRPFDGTGEGSSLRWELNMVRWLEANGFDVGYVSDVDVHRDPAFAARARAVIQAGHSEYWSREMRDHLEAVRDQGKGLGFFTGDTGAWAIRYEDSPLGPDRVEVGYKDSRDPVVDTDPSRSTGHWRDAPLSRPTQAFIGVGTGMGVRRSADWKVEAVDAAPDLFSGTGFHDGDSVPNLVGYEYDGLGTPGAQPEDPPGLRVLGRARVAPSTHFDDQLGFTVAYNLSGAQSQPVGHLTAQVHTLDDKPSWAILVHLVSDAQSVYLVYGAGPTASRPLRFTAGRDNYDYVPLSSEFSDPGWRPFDRDLAADYALFFDTPADDLRVDSITVRGSIGLDAMSLISPTGTVTSVVDLGETATPEAAGWRVMRGAGDVSVESTPWGGRALLISVAYPPNRRSDEADTVFIRDGVRGPVVAVGSIQWSWALDDVAVFGRHADPSAHVTEVDPRVQALTRNILDALART